MYNFSYFFVSVDQDQIMNNVQFNSGFALHCLLYDFLALTLYHKMTIFDVSVGKKKKNFRKHCGKGKHHFPLFPQCLLAFHREIAPLEPQTDIHVVICKCFQFEQG